MDYSCSRLLLWTAVAWVAVPIGTGNGVTINISLFMEPPDLFPLCPGVHRVELHCVHTMESHDPGWRVRGDGLPLFGYAQFGQGLLQNHKIIQDTDTVEVLQIDPVVSRFTYYCLYVVLGEEVITEPLVLDVIDPYEAVMGLQVSIVSESEATVKWNHTDTCSVADVYEVVVRDFTGESVFNGSTEMLTMALSDLLADGKYEVTVSMIGIDGRRGEASSVVFRAGVGPTTPNTVNNTESLPPPSVDLKHNNVTAQSSTLCDVSQVSCSLYTLAAVLVLFAGSALLVLVVALLMCSRRKRRYLKHSVTSATHTTPTRPAPVYQEPRPVALRTAPRSYMYENVEFINVMSLNEQPGGQNSSAESGTFV